MIRSKKAVDWGAVTIPDAAVVGVNLLNGDSVVGAFSRITASTVSLSVFFLGHRTIYDIPKTSISRILWVVN